MPNWIARLFSGTTDYGLPLNYRDTILQDTPVAYYRLGESSGTVATDSSGNGNTGTYSGSGITYSQAGALRSDPNTAAAFATAQVAVPLGATPTTSYTTTAFSLEFWLNFGVVPAYNPSVIACWSTAASQQYGFGTSMHTDGTVRFGMCTTINSVVQIISPALSTATWHHIVCTWDKTTMVLYCDGISRGTLVPSTTQAATTQLLIGNSSYNDYYAGSFDEVAIYNVALTSAQVDAHYIAAITSNKDLTQRLRLSVTTLRDVVQRLRLQVTPLQNVSQRLFLQAIGIRDQSQRLKLQVTMLRDLAQRARVQAIGTKDLFSRLRVLAIGTKDQMQRLRLQVTSLRDMAQRFRQQAISIRDDLQRLRLQDLSSRNVAQRVRLQLVTLRDVVQRLRLQVTILRDQMLRLRLQDLGVRNVAQRARLQATILRDLIQRLRLQATGTRDLKQRLLLQIIQLRDLTQRFRQQATSIRDNLLRVRLQDLSLRNLAQRARLQALSVRDIAQRARIQALVTRDLKQRFLLQIIQIRDIGQRLRQQATILRNQAQRVRLQDLSLRNLTQRARLQALATKDQIQRLLLQGTSIKDLKQRFPLQQILLRNQAQRFRLQLTTFRNIAQRFLLQGTNLKDLKQRLALGLIKAKDQSHRLLLQALRIGDVKQRLKFVDTNIFNIGLRTRLKAVVLRDIFIRFLLTTPYMSYQTTIIADNPLRYYQLNETSGTTAVDSTPLTPHNATYTGGFTLNQTSLLGNDPTDGSVLLNGSTGYVNAPTTGLPTGASSWSIECWVKTPSSMPANGNYSPIGMGDSSANQKKGVITLHVSATPTANWDLTTGSGDINGPSTVAANTIYHLVGTYDGTSTRLYVNGALAAGPSAFSLNLVASFASVGANDNTAAFFYSGKVQHAAFYNYALTLAQIANHHTVGQTDLKNLATRLVLKVTNFEMLTQRLRLQVTSLKNISQRVKLVPSSRQDLIQRFRLQTQILRNMALRMRMVPCRDLKYRINIFGPTITKQDVVCRLSLISSQGTLFTTPARSPGVSYAGTGGMMPLADTIVKTYTINGLLLDTPNICTTPMTSNGVSVPAGSSFVLFFVNPSPRTQALLVNGTTVQMTFLLFSG
jgi:hypothetical protein